MMNYEIMSGVGVGNGMMFFAWTTYTLGTILLILGIVSLWKYINKK